MFQIVAKQTLPARGLKGSAFIGDQLGVAAGSLGEDRATVHVGMVVPSLVVPHNLEGLAVLHNLGGQASQAHYPGEEESRAGEGKAPSPHSAATPKQQVNPEKANPLPQQTGETDGLQQACQEVTRSLTDLLHHHHQLRKSLSRLTENPKTEGCISSRTALRKTLLAQQDCFCVCPWSLHVPSHGFSGLLHTTYRPQGQLAKHRAPAESEQGTSSRNILVT